jgi:hypothetical protein
MNSAQRIYASWTVPCITSQVPAPVTIFKRNYLDFATLILYLCLYNQGMLLGAHIWTVIVLGWRPIKSQLVCWPAVAWYIILVQLFFLTRMRSPGLQMPRPHAIYVNAWTLDDLAVTWRPYQHKIEDDVKYTRLLFSTEDIRTGRHICAWAACWYTYTWTLKAFSVQPTCEL